jgi:hypothetical protein
MSAIRQALFGRRYAHGQPARFMAMSAKDHPNNAPGVPMIYPPVVERLQVKYFNPMIKPIARFLPGMATIKHRGRKSGKPYETIVTARATCWPSPSAMGKRTG